MGCLNSLEATDFRIARGLFSGADKWKKWGNTRMKQQRKQRSLQRLERAYPCPVSSMPHASGGSAEDLRLRDLAFFCQEKSFGMRALGSWLQDAVQGTGV